MVFLPVYILMCHSEAIPVCDCQKYRKVLLYMPTEFTAKAYVLNTSVRNCMELNFNLMPELENQFKYVQYF